MAAGTGSESSRHHTSLTHSCPALPSPPPFSQLQKHSSGVLNGWWRRQRFDHAGKPVFKASGHYLYFRPDSDVAPSEEQFSTPLPPVPSGVSLSAVEPNRLPAASSEVSAGRWVIDKTIRVGGVPVSASLSADIQGAWLTYASFDKPPWARLRCNMHQSPQAVTMALGTGPMPDGTVLPPMLVGFQAILDGYDLNGRYHLQTERLNGHNHYVKDAKGSAGGGGASMGGVGLGGAAPTATGKREKRQYESLLAESRRHLFYSQTLMTWVIGLRCDEIEGVLARWANTGQDMFKGAVSGEEEWAVCFAPKGLGNPATAHLSQLHLGPQTYEGVDTYGEQERELVLMVLSAERAEEEFGVADDDKSKAAKAFSDAASEELGDLLPWAASNHEAMVMTSRGPNKGSLHMLCKNANKMRLGMHPGTMRLGRFR